MYFVIRSLHLHSFVRSCRPFIDFLMFTLCLRSLLFTTFDSYFVIVYFSFSTRCCFLNNFCNYMCRRIYMYMCTYFYIFLLVGGRMVVFYSHLCSFFVFFLLHRSANRKQNFMFLIVFNYSLKCMYCSCVLRAWADFFPPVNQYSNLRHLAHLQVKCVCVLESPSHTMSFPSLAVGEEVTLLSNSFGSHRYTAVLSNGDRERYCTDFH